MAIEDNGCKTHAASQTRCLALCLFNVLHVLLLVQSSLLTDGAQISDIAIIGSQLAMAADDSVADFSWEVNLVIEYEVGVRVGHRTDEGHELFSKVVASLLGHLRRKVVNGVKQNCSLICLIHLFKEFLGYWIIKQEGMLN
jgi:hypothetical protein